MTYKEIIKKVQDYSGFSDRESEDSLRLIVETLSSRLQEGEREDFASQLPDELQEVALTPVDGMKFSKDEMYQELSEIEGIDRGHVKKQLMAVWQALKDAISPGEIRHIKAQLPNDMAMELH